MKNQIYVILILIIFFLSCFTTNKKIKIEKNSVLIECINDSCMNSGFESMKLSFSIKNMSDKCFWINNLGMCNAGGFKRLNGQLVDMKFSVLSGVSTLNTSKYQVLEVGDIDTITIQYPDIILNCEFPKNDSLLIYQGVYNCGEQKRDKQIPTLIGMILAVPKEIKICR